MKAVLQRVESASVSVDESVVARIGTGYLILLGVMGGDTEEQAYTLARKICALRLFDGEDGKINDRSILDVDGEALVVSQFTLAGSVERGNRPDYTAAAKPDRALPLYEAFADRLKEEGIGNVRTGSFGSHMHIESVNDGPVTLLLECNLDA